MPFSLLFAALNLTKKIINNNSMILIEKNAFILCENAIKFK